MRTDVIKWIIVLVVVLITIFWASNAFSTEIIPGLNEFFSKFAPGLTTEEKSGSEKNFQSFIDNIDICLQKTQTDCLCDGLNDYPGTFPKSTKLYFTTSGTKTKIELKSNSGVLMQGEKPVGIIAVLLDKNGLNFNDARWKYDNTNEKWIDYNKEPPFFANKKGATDGIKLASGKIYKGTEKTVLFLIFSENINEFNSNTLNKPICVQ